MTVQDLSAFIYALPLSVQKESESAGIRYNASFFCPNYRAASLLSPGSHFFGIAVRAQEYRLHPGVKYKKIFKVRLMREIFSAFTALGFVYLIIKTGG